MAPEFSYLLAPSIGTAAHEMQIALEFQIL
jgi:hypothetical protein